jgi:ABC-2 type transport system ATP-binding protein
MMDGTSALVASGLGKRYGRRWAVRGVDLRVPYGSVVALVGDNGAGKTTLLHLAVGLFPPDAGGLTVLGRRPGPESLEDVGFVAQDKPLYRDFRVRDLVELGRRLNRRWDRAYVSSRLSELDIPSDRRAGQLSGGQRAQVALTLALGKRPRLLLLDEPLADLDPLARRQFMAAVAAQVAESGTTVVHSSHDLAELNRGCDHVIIMRRGGVILAGDVRDVVPDGTALEDLILTEMSVTR